MSFSLVKYIKLHTYTFEYTAILNAILLYIFEYNAILT